MAKRISPEKVAALIKKFDSGTLTEEERKVVRKIMEESIKMGIVRIAPSK
jgi:hypothetical protein